MVSLVPTVAVKYGFAGVGITDDRCCFSYKVDVLGNVPYSLKSTSSATRLKIACHGMLAPRKFMRRKKKVGEEFKDDTTKAEVVKWRKMMVEIEQSGSAVPVLKNQLANSIKKDKNAGSPSLPYSVVIGTLVRFKQLKKWNIVSEILEWLKSQQWWNFSEMDFLMLITAYGKLADFNKAEKVLSLMEKKGYPPSVISHTALMEAYGRAGQYNKAEAIFRRMQISGPAPSPLTYQIILKSFVQGEKYKEAEMVFQSLMSEDSSTFKPDQKMFHMMIYMYKKAGNYEQARKIFAQMAEKGVPHSTITFNSLMSFENNYKEVSKIYDQMQRSGLKPDVVSYTLLINAYGKARREEEALAVFEEMLDAGVRPTHKAYNILLDAFAISGMAEEARTVFKSMRRDRITPDLCSYATMLSAYVNASDMEGAEKFFRRIKDDGLRPNVVVYGTLMKGYAKANNVEKVMRVYERMRIQGVEANQTIFTTIMDAHGKNSDFGSAVVWFKEMIARGFPPDKKASNILLSLAKTAEEVHEANVLVGNYDHEHDDELQKQLDVSNEKFSDLDNDEDEDDDDSDEDELDIVSDESEEILLSV